MQSLMLPRERRDKRQFEEWSQCHDKRFVKVWHKSLHRWFLIESDHSPYSRSLRKFRKKLRFNLVSGVFRPNLFLTLTFDRKHFNKKTAAINCSDYVRNFFQALRKNPESGVLAYAWRVECGTQGTKRPHIHCLIQLKRPPKIKSKLLYDVKTGQYTPMSVWIWHRLWPGGKITDAKKLGQTDLDAIMVSNYITKYFSKNEKGGELEPDPVLYTGQRFNTSRNLIKPPKSCFKQPVEFNNPEIANKAIDENIEFCAIEMATQKSNFANPNYSNVDLKEVFHKRAEFLYPRYWFEGENPGTTMRDYVYETQKIRNEKRIQAIANRKAARSRASVIGGGAPMEATVISSAPPALLETNPFSHYLENNKDV